MKKFLIKIGSYGIVFFVILNIISFLSLYFLSKSNFYKPEFIENGVPEKQFDYLVLGSSTGLTTLNTVLIDSLIQKKGLNISLDDSSLSSHYLMLNHFYQVNKKTKALILAITPWDISENNPKINENDYRFLPYINRKYVYDYYVALQKSKINVLALSRYFPILGVSYYNSELFYPSLLTIFKPNKRNRFDEKGNYSYPTSGNPVAEKKKEIKLSCKNPYFFKIKEFCTTHKIKLIVYQSPIYKTKVVTKELDFILINHSNLINEPTFFYDNIHVNEKGRKLCSSLVSGYLNKKGN